LSINSSNLLRTWATTYVPMCVCIYNVYKLLYSMYASSSLIQPVDCQIKITVDSATVSKLKGTRFDPFVQMSATIGSPKVHHPSRFRESLRKGRQNHSGRRTGRNDQITDNSKILASYCKMALLGGNKSRYIYLLRVEKHHDTKTP